MDAEMPARRPRPGASVALRETAPRAASRRPVHHRGDGDVAWQPRKAAGYRGDAARQFRADAGQISRGPKRAARACAKAEAEAGLPPPQTGLTGPWLPIPDGAYNSSPPSAHVA